MRIVDQTLPFHRMGTRLVSLHLCIHRVEVMRVEKLCHRAEAPWKFDIYQSVECFH